MSTDTKQTYDEWRAARLTAADDQATVSTASIVTLGNVEADELNATKAKATTKKS